MNDLSEKGAAQMPLISHSIRVSISLNRKNNILNENGYTIRYFEFATK